MRNLGEQSLAYCKQEFQIVASDLSGFVDYLLVHL